MKTSILPLCFEPVNKNHFICLAMALFPFCKTLNGNYSKLHSDVFTCLAWNISYSVYTYLFPFPCFLWKSAHWKITWPALCLPIFTYPVSNGATSTRVPLVILESWTHHEKTNAPAASLRSLFHPHGQMVKNNFLSPSTTAKAWPWHLQLLLWTLPISLQTGTKSEKYLHPQPP